MKWLLLSASNTKRIPGKLNPTFQEAHIYFFIKNLPITFFHLKLPENEQKMVEKVIHFLALDFIKDREVQQFFAHFLISWEAREKDIKESMIPYGALINAHLTGLWSILYFLFSFEKHQIPFHDKFKIITQDAGKVVFGSLLLQIFLYGMGKSGPFKLEHMTQDLISFISTHSPVSIKAAYDLTLKRFPNFPLMSMRAGIIGIPLLSSIFAIKKFHDTTVTPSYVLKLTREFKKEQEEDPNTAMKHLRKDKLNTQSTFLFFSRKTLLITGAVMASSILLFYDFRKISFTIEAPKPALT